jgi:hypothetical protein
MLKDQVMYAIYNKQNGHQVEFFIDPTASIVAEVKAKYPDSQYKHESLDGETFLLKCFAEDCYAEDEE